MQINKIVTTCVTCVVSLVGADERQSASDLLGVFRQWENH